ncbi:MAG: c-type cytochrome [Kofleriaceae bacterium]
MRHRALRFALVAFGVAIGCSDRTVVEAVAEASPAAKPHEHELTALRELEDQRRAATDFAALPGSDRSLGPDPYRIARVTRDRFVGVLRGESAVVLLGATGTELARAAAPRSPSGLAVTGAGDVLVVGEGARGIAQFRVGDRGLERVAMLPVDALGLRDVALSPDRRTAYVIEEIDGRLLEVSLARVQNHALAVARVRELGRCHGPVQVRTAGDYVAVNCLLDRALELRQRTAGRAGSVVKIQHDGPLWGFAIEPSANGLIIAAGGVEDHPLERSDGGFGYIDSFVYLYRWASAAATPERVAAVNVSEHGVVTPKWLAVRTSDNAVSITTAGYGSAGLLTLRWRDDEREPPQLSRVDLPPGTAAAMLDDDGSVIAANPLFDSWVIQREGALRLVAAGGKQQPRSIESRLGELALFTTLMAPWNSSDGKLSRFTCETCHHEGYSDGRVHYTGRDTVHAATRPLYGLFNNRPHFSRALDNTTTQMVHAEFRVANRYNGRDPWFAVSAADVPWLGFIEGAPGELSPVMLRESLMAFLAAFTHRANPAATDLSQFTPSVRAGARVFRDRCASCHEPRLVTDDASSTVPFERWESLVLSANGPIVWARAGYEKTGVTPYVHADGARAPSLRRLYKKWPYFTNGSGGSLGDVLARFGWTTDASFHDDAPGAAARLTADDRDALLAFLRLL